MNLQDAELIIWIRNTLIEMQQKIEEIEKEHKKQKKTTIKNHTTKIEEK